MIVDMQRLIICGMDSCKESLLKFLQQQGVVHISDLSGAAEELGVCKEEVDVSSADANLDAAKRALKIIDDAVPAKHGFIAEKRAAMGICVSETVQIAQDICRLRDEYLTLKAEETALEGKIKSLGPWQDYDLPLSRKETKYTEIMTGTLPLRCDAEAAREALLESGAVLTEISRDNLQIYVSVLFAKKHRAETENILQEIGFLRVTPAGGEKTVKDSIKALEKTLTAHRARRKEIDAEIEKAAAFRRQIEELYDFSMVEKERLLAKARLVHSQKAFYLSGWVPASLAEDLCGKTEEQFDCVAETETPKEDEAYPILLQNKKLVRPFEMITAQYSLPKPHGFDPNAVMAPFYFLFFGMMLSDAGYGFLLSIICSFILLRFKPQGMTKQLMSMMALCGISTMFWGIMFGSAFGDLLGFRAVLYDPVKQPMRLLILSCVLGGIHLLAGLGCQGYILIKDGKPWDAFWDVGGWYLTLIGIGLLFVKGTAGTVGKYMAIAGSVVLFIGGGRTQKNIFKKFTGGFSNIYGITGYLGDVLSYSRILALGLATGVIATVINQMGSMGGPVMMVIVGVVGHTFNLAINLLGAYVHTSRLQYVEFFGKFYEGGGKAFTPLTIKTKYTLLKEEF